MEPTIILIKSPINVTLKWCLIIFYYFFNFNKLHIKTKFKDIEFSNIYSKTSLIRHCVLEQILTLLYTEITKMIKIFSIAWCKMTFNKFYEKR